jgi:hypothetical protein
MALQLLLQNETCRSIESLHKDDKTQQYRRRQTWTQKEREEKNAKMRQRWRFQSPKLSSFHVRILSETPDSARYGFRLV